MVNKEKKAIIINELIQVSPDRTRKDIAHLKTNLETAESIISPNRADLYDLYYDILSLDGKLSGMLQKRTAGITNKEILYQDRERHTIENAIDLINSERFTRLLELIIESKYWGISGIEFLTSNEIFDFLEIPRKHIHPETGIISKSQYGSAGFNVEDYPDIMLIGEKRDLGILLHCAMYALYKRNGFGDYAQFVEIFGQPVRILKYDGYDEKVKQDLRKILRESGSSLAMMLPRQVDFEMMDGKTSNGNGDLQQKYIQICNEEMAVAVLGVTETTTSSTSSGYAQAEIHSEQQLEITKSDMRYVLHILNSEHFKRILKKFGYQEGTFSFKKDIDLNVLNNKLKIDLQIAQKVPIADEYWYETYNIPRPDNYNALKKEMQVQSQARQKTQNQADFFAGAPARPGAILNLADGTDLPGWIEPALKRLYENKTSYFDNDIFRQIADNLIQAVRRGLRKRKRKLAFDYNKKDAWFEVGLEQNIYHFSAAKTIAELQELNQTLQQAKDYNDFKKHAATIAATFNKKWQQSEYDTAVLTSESVSNYHQLLSDSDVFPYWKYVTAGDDKVRPEHAALDGLVLPATDKAWDEIFPPNGWNCRCSVQGVMRDEVKTTVRQGHEQVNAFKKTTEYANAKAQGWAINRGKQDLVFARNQMYVNKFPSMAGKMLEKIKPAEWGIKSYDTLRNEATRKISEYKGTPAEWWDKNKITIDGTDYLAINDYAGRQWLMTKRSFDIHTLNTDKTRAFRAQYLDIIQSIAKNPDECWLGRDATAKNNDIKMINNYIMLNYYKGKVIAVVCKIEKQNLVFKTWYEVKNKSIRNGILLKK